MEEWMVESEYSGLGEKSAVPWTIDSRVSACV
jgi:hypothetical protein